MPDLDIAGKSVSPFFANAYRLIRGRQDDVSIATAVRRGLAQHAATGGIPGLRERAALAMNAAGPAHASAVMLSQAMTITEGGSRNAKIAHRALTRMLADGHRPTNTAEAEHLIAKYAMDLMLEHRLLAGARVDPDVGLSYEEFRLLEERLHDLIADDIDSLARQLVEDPSGAAIRLPPTPAGRRVRRMRAIDVLAQEV